MGDGIRVADVLDPLGNVFGIIENPHFKLPANIEDRKERDMKQRLAASKSPCSRCRMTEVSSADLLGRMLLTKKFSGDLDGVRARADVVRDHRHEGLGRLCGHRSGHRHARRAQGRFRAAALGTHESRRAIAVGHGGAGFGHGRARRHHGHARASTSSKANTSTTSFIRFLRSSTANRRLAIHARKAHEKQLEELLAHPSVWRGRSRAAVETLPTGFRRARCGASGRRLAASRPR